MPRSRKLSTELDNYGVKMGPDPFRKLLGDKFARMYPGKRVEWLTHNPSKAIQFVIAVRSAVGVALPEEFVMRRLTNLRKSRRSPEKGVKT